MSSHTTLRYADSAGPETARPHDYQMGNFDFEIDRILYRWSRDEYAAPLDELTSDIRMRCERYASRCVDARGNEAPTHDDYMLLTLALTNAMTSLFRRDEAGDFPPARSNIVGTVTVYWPTFEVALGRLTTTALRRVYADFIDSAEEFVRLCDAQSRAIDEFRDWGVTVINTATEWGGV